MGTGVASRTGSVAAAAASVEEWLYAERHQLAHWIPVALGLGIAAYFALPTATQWAATAGLGLAAAAAGFALSGYLGRVLLWGGLLVAAGVGLAFLRAEMVAAPRLERELVNSTVTATVADLEDQSGRGRYRLLLRPDDPALPPLVRITLRKAPPAAVEPGARVRLRVSLRAPPGASLPGGFDFARRAWFNGIGAMGYSLGEVTVLAPAPPPSGPAARIASLRRTITHQLQQGVGGDEGGIAAALVTGDTGAISEPVAQAMRDAGLAHLISISGLHITIVVGGTMLLVRRALTLSSRLALRLPVKMIAAAAAALTGIVYTLIAGSQVPTVRSCIGALIVLAAMSLGRQAISLRLIAAAAFIILVVRPEALLGASFQLSFAAVTGLVAAFQSPLGKRLLARPENPTLGAKLAVGLLGLVLSGLVAEAMLSPIALYHFNRSGFYGILVNLVAIPLTSIVIMPALVAALLFDIVGLAGPVFWLLSKSIGLLVWIATTVAAWPGAVMTAATMPPPAFALFVSGMMWLCLWKGRARLFGLAGPAVALLLSLASRPPDLFVSADGRHVGHVMDDGSLAMLRPRAGDFLKDMWGGSAAAPKVTEFDSLANASCTRDACTIAIDRGARRWTMLATRSSDLVDRPAFEAACRAVDIVVSERRLPPWCAPRWLKLDRTTLAATGAVSLRLDPPDVLTVADLHGEHPWATGIDPSRDAARKTSPVARHADGRSSVAAGARLDPQS